MDGRRLDTSGRRTGFTFSVRQLLILTASIALPLALFGRYWAKANDTVDERTIPLSNMPLWATAFLIASGIVSFIVLALILRWLIVRWKNWPARIGLLIVIVSPFLCIPLFWTRLIDPVRGNPNAMLHNDAAALAAMAVANHLQRTGRWPQSWSDLSEDVVVASRVSYRLPSGGSPPGSPPIPVHNNVAKGLRIDQLSKLVVIDFDAKPEALKSQSWHTFSGIKPLKPSYNYYREQFLDLIAKLNE